MNSIRRISTLLAAVVWLVALAGLVSLAIRASTGHVLAIDVSVSKQVQALPPWLGPWFDLENKLGATFPLAAVTLAAAVLLARRGHLPEAVTLLLTFLPRMADVVVKRLVAEPRPSPDLVRVQFPHDNLGFPSGHVIGYTLVFGVFWLVAPVMTSSRGGRLAIRLLCSLLVATIWMARVWVGAHWPSDTLGGYCYALVFLIPLAALREFDSVASFRAKKSFSRKPT